MKASLVVAALVCVVPMLEAGQVAPSAGERVTVNGCLQRAQRTGSVGGTVVGTSAAPNTADDEANSSAMVNAFLLTEAVPAIPGATADESARAPQPAGTSGQVTMTTYGLIGREAELERHQGARLQVTGTVAPPAQSGRGSGGAATAAGAKRLNVESFKILADRCVSR